MVKTAIMALVVGFFLSATTALTKASTEEIPSSSDKNGVRGVVRAVRQAEIRSDLTARVKATPFREGENFAEGDVLIKFDCRAFYAETEAVDAAYHAAKVRYENTVEMNKFNAAGLYDVEIHKAEMNEAGSRVKAAKARVDSCIIKAPYPGRVAELYVNPFETPNASQPLLKIVGAGELEIRLIAPSKWLSWINVGTKLAFVVDETGGKYDAVVRNIGAEVDAVSGTVPIIATFNNPEAGILPGMSGVAFFQKAKE